MSDETKRPMGRPTLYTEELGRQIHEKMKEGLSIVAAAAELEVSRSTVYRWAEQNPHFSDTLDISRGSRQAFLERRLLAADVTGPVVTSSMFALKNAAPDDWRDKREVELSGAVDTDALTDEQKAALIKLTSR